MNVPWDASWSGEDRFEIRPCRWAGGRPAIWSPHLPGQGTPLFAKPHPVRQRRSIAEMRCTVCGERVGKGYYDRWWFGIGNAGFDGFSFMTTEAPVRRDCAELGGRAGQDRARGHRYRARARDRSADPEPDGVGAGG